MKRTLKTLTLVATGLVVGVVVGRVKKYIEDLENKLDLKVDKHNIISQINLSDEGIRIRQGLNELDSCKDGAIIKNARLKRYQ